MGIGSNPRSSLSSAVVAEMERDGSLDEHRRNRRRRWWRAYALTACLFFPILLVANAYVIGEQFNGRSAGTVAAPADLDVPGKALALATLEKWLGSANQPVPGGRMLSWDGGSEVEKTLTEKAPRNSAEVADPPTYFVHKMTVIDKSGQLYDSVVQVAVTSKNGSEVVGEPSLIPRAPDAKSNTYAAASPWPGIVASSVPEPVRQAVADWVRAYSSSDPSSLRLAVGDPSADNVYMPLMGATASDVNVSIGAGLWAGKDHQSTDIAPRMLARVSFAVKWPTQSGADKAATTLPRITMDLLVTASDSGSPKVVAWGGPGSGPTLTEYQNAITGRDLSITKPQPTSGP